VKSRLLLAGLAFWAAFSLPPTAAAASASQVAGADLIRSIANTKGHVRLIARLKAAPQPEQTLSEAHLAAAHAQIEGVMQAVRVRYVRRLPDVPLTVVDVDASQLQTLLDSGLVDAHNVRVRRTPRGLILTLHCRAAPQMPVQEVHERVDALERRIRASIDDIARIVTHAEPIR